MSETISIMFDENGKAKIYDDTFDITIHCESEEEQNKVLEILNRQWIPVSERLPEQHKEVIVTDIETSDTYLSRYIGDGYWECDNGLFKNRIIAWMLLPDPYDAESEDDKE